MPFDSPHGCLKAKARNAAADLGFSQAVLCVAKDGVTDVAHACGEQVVALLKSQVGGQFGSGRACFGETIHTCSIGSGFRYFTRHDPEHRGEGPLSRAVSRGYLCGLMRGLPRRCLKLEVMSGPFLLRASGGIQPRWGAAVATPSGKSVKTSDLVSDSLDFASTSQRYSPSPLDSNIDKGIKCTLFALEPVATREQVRKHHHD